MGNGKSENLIPMNKRTKEEQSEIAQKGGQASGVARRKKRDAKAAAKLILNLPVQEKLEDNLKALGVGEEDYTNRVAIMARALTLAMAGDLRAMDFLISTAGEMPSFQLSEKQYRDKKKKPMSEKEEAFQKLEEVLETIFRGDDSQ